MVSYIAMGLLGLPVGMGMLSGWMRYPGYYLAGHTRRQEFSVATVDTCWEACLQETSFSCLAVAYSGVESQTCRLYDKRALSVLGDWTSSAGFTYYEYCADGIWTWTFYPQMTVLNQNIDILSNLDVQGCLEACRSEPACLSVDYRASDRTCWRNDATGLDKPWTWTDSYPAFDVYNHCKQVSYDLVYKPMLTARDVPYNRFQLRVLHTSSLTDVKTLEVRPKFRCALYCHDDPNCLGFKFSSTSTLGVTVCHIIMQI